MPINLCRWYLDTTNNRLVTGDANQSPIVELPDFYQGDVFPVELILLEVNPSGGYKAPFTKLTDASISAKVGIVKPSSSAATEYASVNLVFDGVDRWKGTLSLNTAEMNTLLSSVSSADAYLEIELSTGSGIVSTELQRACKVLADGLKTGTPPTTPGETYVTSSQFENEAAKKVGAPGDSITLTSADGLMRLNLSVVKDAVTGEYKFQQSWEQITP